MGAQDQEDVGHVAGTQKRDGSLFSQRRAHSSSQPWPGRRERIGGQEAEMRQTGGLPFCRWPHFAASGAYTRNAQCAAQPSKWLQWQSSPGVRGQNVAGRKAAAEEDETVPRPTSLARRPAPAVEEELPSALLPSPPACLPSEPPRARTPCNTLVQQQFEGFGLE